jgi:acyl-CoA thioester hydrolase/thioesterase-3
MESESQPDAAPQGTKFETELQVRPDDIDMFQHVHASRYQDYVLAARFDQMKRCYKMSMEEFMAQDLGWFVNDFYIEYKRQLKLAECFTVRTWVEQCFRTGVKVQFEIIKKDSQKLSSRGYSNYGLIHLASGRPATIPEEILVKYSI